MSDNDKYRAMVRTGPRNTKTLAAELPEGTIVRSGYNGAIGMVCAKATGRFVQYFNGGFDPGNTAVYPIEGARLEVPE